VTVENAEREGIGGAGAPPRPGARSPGWRGLSRWRDAPDWRDWLPAAVLGAGAVAGTVLFFAPLGQVTAALGRMSGLGLISVMPAAALAGRRSRHRL